MRNSDDVFNSHLMEVVRNFPGDDKKKPGSEDKLLQDLLKVLLFVGAEALFAIFRKNFGKKGINLLRLSIAFLCFIFIAARLIYKFSNDDNFNEDYGSRESYLVTGFLLILLALTFLIKGISHFKNAKRESDYTGDSNLLSFLTKDGWKQQTIQLIAEPVSVIAVGAAYCFYNVWGGVAIVFCGISVWGRTLLELFYLGNRIQSNINSQSSNQNPDITHVS